MNAEKGVKEVEYERLFFFINVRGRERKEPEREREKEEGRLACFSHLLFFHCDSFLFSFSSWASFSQLSFSFTSHLIKNRPERKERGKYIIMYKVSSLVYSAVKAIYKYVYTISYTYILTSKTEPWHVHGIFLNNGFSWSCWVVVVGWDGIRGRMKNWIEIGSQKLLLSLPAWNVISDRDHHPELYFLS